MIKFIPDDLRSLADKIENQHKYGDKKNYVILTIQEHPNGKKYAEFEQPCEYAECFSAYHRYEEV